MARGGRFTLAQLVQYLHRDRHGKGTCSWRGRWMAWAALVLFAAALPLLGSCNGEDGHVRVRELRSGDTVRLGSGLAITLPDATSGDYSIADVEFDPHGMVAEAVEFGGRPGEQSLSDVEIYTFWSDEAAMVRGVRRWTLVAESSDRTVQVRWGLRGTQRSAVAIMTCAQGKRVGLLIKYGLHAVSEPDAWQEAKRIWQLLSVRGIAFPE